MERLGAAGCDTMGIAPSQGGPDQFAEWDICSRDCWLGARPAPDVRRGGALLAGRLLSPVATGRRI